MLLLAFGRTYRTRSGGVYDAIFKLKVSSNQTIGQLARHLNDLQELRNLAAHRCTLRESSPGLELRGRCFEALNEIEGVI